jgi:polar amino acid transport system substrate-binding protein
VLSKGRDRLANHAGVAGKPFIREGNDPVRKMLVLTAIVAILASACGEETTPPAASPQPTGTALECTPDTLNLVNAGQLTVGTDNPAFPPWFSGGETDEHPEWAFDDPYTAEGFEAELAYLVAEQLGFSEDQVEWVALPYTASYKPGPKDFDFYLAQVSITERRERNADFSVGYYDVAQALIALDGEPITEATSLEELKEFTLGAPIGSTSYEYITDVIQPTVQPKVYDTLNDANSALQAGQIDGEVVDYDTAFFITGSGEVENSVVVGQFPQTGGTTEQFGLVLEQGNPLKACLDQALESLRADGTLQAAQEEWLDQAAEAPVLE